MWDHGQGILLHSGIRAKAQQQRTPKFDGRGTCRLLTSCVCVCACVRVCMCACSDGLLATRTGVFNPPRNKVNANVGRVQTRVIILKSLYSPPISALPARAPGGGGRGCVQRPTQWNVTPAAPASLRGSTAIASDRPPPSTDNAVARSKAAVACAMAAMPRLCC